MKQPLERCIQVEGLLVSGGDHASIKGEMRMTLGRSFVTSARSEPE
jgi:hypothetical protein